MPVIDAHSHIYPDKIACKASSAVGDFYGVDMNAKNASAASMLAACEGSPITHHLVHSVATTPGQVPIINDFIAEQCRAHDNFVGFATMHQDFEDVEGEIDRAIQLGLKGVKIHPDTQKVNMDDPRLMRLYEIIEGRLPIVIHTGDYRYDYSHPRRLKKVLHAFPNLVVDAAHFGGWNAWDRSLAHPQPENVFYDTSSTTPMIPHDMVMRMFETFGPERFLFGTDFPMWSPEEMVRQFLTYDLGDSLREQILYGNFMRLFGLSDGQDK